MSKAVGAIALGVGLIAVAVFVPGVGTAIAGAAFSASSAAGVVASAATLAAIQAGAATFIVVTGLTIAANGIQMARAANAISPAQLTRLNANLDPSAPRKIAFGNTALATDLRASIPTGTDQEIHEYIICVASHTVESIDQIWFEDRQAWTLAGGVTSYYSGYMSAVSVRNPGTNANGIAINSQWPATSTLTGCAYIYFHIKRTGNSKKAESPLPQGMPSRVTIIGKGMKVYDPRLDSTVTGGSGTHRADDQTTWEYSHSGTDIGNNPALQILAYRLGWQINSKLAVGKGMLPERLDLPSFITAANICDEPVTLAIGGTQRRYETHGLFSEADQTSSVENALLFACNGRMTDHNGKLGIALAYNDLTGTLYEFDDDDVLGAFDWNPSPSIHETHNIIRGRWTDPSSNSLYQMVDYPAIRITSPDGIDRTLPIDLPVVQDGKRAQRIAKQILQREQYQGTFAAIFGIRAWGVKVGDPVKLTFDTLGFVEKLFRVVQQGIRSDGTVQLILREEATALYAWAAEETALVTVAAPTVYDQLNNPLAVINGVDIGVENGADVTATNAPDVTGDFAWPIGGDAAGTVTTTLPANRRYVATQGGTDVSATATWVLSGIGAQVALTVNNTSDRGLVTLGSGTTGSGVATLTVTFATGAIVVRTITITKTNAALPATGGAGATSATDTSFLSVTSGSHATISDELTVRSDGSGNVRISASSEFDAAATATQNVAVKFAYATSSGGGLTDLISEVTANAAIWNSGDSALEPGSFNIAEATFAMPASNTDYYFKLRARRVTGSATINFYNSAFTVRQ